MHGVVGIQISTRCTGMCFIPPDWDVTRSSVRTQCIESEREAPAYGRQQVLARLEAERYLRIADSVKRFVKDSGTRVVATEKYSYSKEGVSVYALANAELGGVIKSQLLLSCRAPVAPFAVSTVRSFLTGGLKRGEDQKTQVEKFMRGHGFRFDNRSEMGAFVVAYYWYCQVNNWQNRFLPQQPLF